MNPAEDQLTETNRDLKKACQLIRRLTGEAAERLACDMDHRSKDHSRWYRAVKAGRKFLTA